MFTFASVRKFVCSFLGGICVDHELMAAEVRALGPEIFRRLIAVKRAKNLGPLDSTMSIYFTVTTPFERGDVLESRDFYAALDDRSLARDFGPRERAVIQYCATYINTVGERVGSMYVLAPRGGATFAFSVVREGRLDVYGL